jgi:foldase protein PrsA
MIISYLRKNTSIIVWAFLGIFLIFGVFFTYGAFAPGLKPDQSRKDSKPLANTLRVDGVDVPTEIYNYKYVQFKQNYEAQSGQRMNNYVADLFLRSQSVDIFVSQELFLQEANKRNITADSAEITKAINEEKERIVGPERKAKAKGAKAKFQNVAADKEREDEFRGYLLRMGVTYETYKEMMKKDVIQRKTALAIGEELAKKEKGNLEKRAADMITRVNTGEPFENLARQFSEDESTRENGGQLGWIKRGTLFEQFEKAAFSLAPGQVAPKPVETQLGFHIIKLIDKKTASGPEFEAEKPKIEARLIAAKKDDKYKPTDAEIKNEYEAILPAHILIKNKDAQQLAQEWVRKQISGGKHKVEILDLELKAYRYLMRQYFEPGAAAPDLNEAIKLYEEAIKVNPNNQWLYYQLGTVYEQKNAEAGMRAIADDPYSAAMDNKDSDAGASPDNPKQVEVKSAEGDASKAKKTDAGKTAKADANEYLKEALEAYKQAKKIADDKYEYNSMLMLPVARVAQSLNNKKLAVDTFTEAVDFSVGEKAALTQIRDGLSKYQSDAKVKKTLVEVEKLIKELEALEVDPYDAAAGEQVEEEPAEQESEYLVPESKKKK